MDVLQTLSRRYPGVQFAAVAISGSRADTAALVRSHHWTIPIAYDRDGAVGGLYGVAVCPMAELAARGGIVRDRLVGDQWQTVAEIGSPSRRAGSRLGTMSEPDAALRPAEGFVEPEVAAEFPGLRLQWATADGRRRPSPPPVLRSLQQVANRYRGASVVAMRTKPVPQAYRAFFRQIGLDPDVQRIPSERVALARLVQGGFRSADLITDACLIALIETGVAVTPLDADRVDAGGLGMRPAVPADIERAGVDCGRLEPGTLAVADRNGVHAPLFGEPLAGHGPGSATERVDALHGRRRRGARDPSRGGAVDRARAARIGLRGSAAGRPRPRVPARSEPSSVVTGIAKVVTWGARSRTPRLHTRLRSTRPACWLRAPRPTSVPDAGR